MRTNTPAGKLMRRGNLERVKASATVDSSGRVDLTDDNNWEFVQKRWFEIVPKSSRQFLLGDQQRANVSHQVTMRYDTLSSSITQGWRMNHRGKFYNFAGPPIDRNLDKVLLDFPATEVPGT